MNEQVVERLRKHVADLHVLYVKLHNYHWNVRGPLFKPVHELIESYYDAAAEQFDELAERMLQLGAKPPVTIEEYLRLTGLKENTSTDFSVDQVFDGVRKDFEYLLGGYRETQKLAADSGDPATDGIVTEYITELEKQLWMIGAARS